MKRKQSVLSMEEYHKLLFFPQASFLPRPWPKGTTSSCSTKFAFSVNLSAIIVLNMCGQIDAKGFGNAMKCRGSVDVDESIPILAFFEQKVACLGMVMP